MKAVRWSLRAGWLSAILMLVGLAVLQLILYNGLWKFLSRSVMKAESGTYHIPRDVYFVAVTISKLISNLRPWEYGVLKVAARASGFRCIPRVSRTLVRVPPKVGCIILSRNRVWEIAWKGYARISKYSRAAFQVGAKPWMQTLHGEGNFQHKGDKHPTCTLLEVTQTSALH
jgi:hypothetical protein